MRLVAIYVRTNNDVNGNPRRGWVVCNPRSGATVGFVDSYIGRQALKLAFPDDAIDTLAVEIVTTPGYYRALKRLETHS